MENNEIVNQVGFWSAVLTTIAIVLWVSVTAINAFLPLFFWVNLSALLIAPPFIVLTATIHNLFTERGKKLWSQIALVFSIMYAVIIGQNYFLQMTVVRRNPLSLDVLTMNPNRQDSVFWALEILGYGFMSLAALFISPVFKKAGIEKWIGRLFVINGVFAFIAVIGYVITANPLHFVGLLSVGIWSITFPIATILLAMWFRRAGHATA